MGDEGLKDVDSVRILGVDISSNLKWNSHILGIAKAASKKLGFLSRCRKFFKSHQILQIYKSFIRPCLEYCSNVWGGAAKTKLEYLNSIQRRAIRIINNPTLTDTLDSLEHRRKVGDLSIFYRYYHNYCSKEVSSLMPSPLTFTRTTRLSSTAHKRCVQLFTAHTNDYHKDFFNRTSKLWNDLPEHVFPQTFSKESCQSFKVAVHRFHRHRYPVTK